MADRFQTLEKSKTILVSEGCPVGINAWAIVKDTRTDAVLAQLKLQNMGEERIKACKVAVKAFEINGDPLEGIESFSFLDLNVRQGDTFGSKIPIYLPYNTTRRIEPSITEIVFNDQSIWKSQDEEWKSLPEQKEIVFEDKELERQFQIETKESGKYEPTLFSGFYICTCGTVNLEGHACYHCHNSYDSIQSILLDIPGLERMKEERLTEQAFQKAIANQRERDNPGALKQAEEAFNELGSYKDSEERKQDCHDRILELDRIEKEKEEERQKQLIQQAILRQKNKKKRIIVGSLLAAVACIVFVVLLITVIIPRQALKNKMNQALNMLNAGQYDEAYVLLEELGDTEAIIQNKKERITALTNNGEYDQAYVLMGELGETDKIISSKYDRALSMIKSGEYDAAYDLLEGLNYKDSEQKRLRIDQIRPLLNAKVGTFILFGSYEQDNNSSNGKEEISWLVLAREENKILVVSTYMLDCGDYHSTSKEITWSDCSLRTWLNGSFYNSAFSSEEQKMILSSKVSADYNPEYRTYPGNSTTDKVFLLSVSEVSEYKLQSTRCNPTAYAAAHGAGSFWWTRSPGSNAYNAACVCAPGTMSNGKTVQFLSVSVDANPDTGIRPALWIDIGL